jgi:hypothetical protein
MATVQKTLFTDQDPSTTITQGRSVEDTIRNLEVEGAQILALVAQGTVEKGEVKTSPGMISKKSADQARVEAFTHTPIDHTKTVTAVSTLDLTFANVLDVVTHMVFKNTANDTVGIVDKISSNTCSFISLGATFSASVGDVLIRLGNAYEYGSSSPGYVQKPDDQVYNVMQIFRFPVEISRSLKSTKQLAGNDYFARMSKYNLNEGKKDIERAFIWGQKSNTTTTNVTACTSLGVSVPHMEGLWNWAQNSFNSNGNMTPEKMSKDLILAMDRCVGSTKPLIFLTSREARARFQSWMYEKLMYLKSGELDKFGIKSDTYMSSGPDVNVIAHAGFDYGKDTNKGLLFIPENLQYRYKEGFDLHPKTNIQLPSKDGFMDEITGELCLLALCGGYTITKVENLF